MPPAEDDWTQTLLGELWARWGTSQMRSQGLGTLVAVAQGKSTIALAADSRDTHLISALIERLGDDGPSGMSTHHGDHIVVHPLSERALDALRKLTHVNLGSEPEAWRRWLGRHATDDWQTLYQAALLRADRQFDSLKPWQRNILVESLAEVDAAFLPLAARWLRQPALNSSLVDEGTFSMSSGHYQTTISVLAQLATEGDRRHRSSARCRRSRRRGESHGLPVGRCPGSRGSRRPTRDR